MNKILVYHPFGNQNVRNLVLGFYKHSMLESFHTTVALFQDTLIYKLCKCSSKRMLRRTYLKDLKKYTHCYPFMELIRQSNILNKLGLKNYSSGYINIQVNKYVAKYLSKRYKNVNATYCYAHGAFDIFKVCQGLNIKCLYDLPIEYYKSLLSIINQEKKDNNKWAKYIFTYQQNKSILNIIDEELSLADYVFVASSYVKNSLCNYGWANKQIYVIPYGFPNVNPKYYRKIENEKIKLLYVGGIHQLKGISYMFDAVNNLNDKVELSIIGSLNVKDAQIMNELQKHNYLGSLPHEEVLKHMKNNDILIFPSLSDGFGLVVSEAMSQGTPALVTDHCGVADLIEDNYNGWVVPSRSSYAIQKKIEYIIDNVQLISYCGKNAILTAKSRTWDKYTEDIINIIKNIES